MDDTQHNEWAVVGERIRAARERVGLSMRELARRIDVSPSHVSQVERGLASFSVRALYTVASELGVSMDSLFEPEHDSTAPQRAKSTQRTPADASELDRIGVVLRADRRPSITLNSGPRWERLTPRAEASSEFIEVIYAPASGPNGPPTDVVRHSGREYGIITQGSLDVLVGFEATTLHTGDSIALDSSIPHRFWNNTSQEVRAIWFILDQHDVSAAAPGGAFPNPVANEHLRGQAEHE